jgi:hypothetical protein
LTTPTCGLLFHFTHIDNLEDLLAEGVLLSDTEVQGTELLSVEAGQQEIKERRRSMPVTCDPGGVVADYVPFYFSTRSPMMYKLWQGGVPSFTGPIGDLVYLITDVSTLAEASLPCVVSDRNAAVAFAEFSNDLAVLGDLTCDIPESAFIDWPLMKARQWNRTLQQPDRMERRMAEFLVYQEVPLQLMRGVGVLDNQRQEVVEHMFGIADYDVPVVVRPGWYFP